MNFILKGPKAKIVAILAFVIYLNTLGHEFVLDDAIVVSENVFTQDGLAGWDDLLTKDTFYGFFQADKGNLVSGGRYRPLSPMLFALIYQFFGNNPFIYHLFNILIYAACCYLVFLFFNYLLRRLRIKNHDIIAFFGALFFALHPVHTEVVANIKGADEILSTMGGLACLIFLLRYHQYRRTKDLALVLLTFFLSLLSKENTVTLLGIAPMTWWMVSPKTGLKKAVKPMLFLGTTFLIYFIIRGSVLGWNTLTTPMELMNNPFLKYEGSSLIAFSASEKLGTNFFTLIKYIQLLIFPHPLIHDYYPRQIPIYSMTQIWPLISLVAHIGLAGWALLKIRQRSIWAYGILFYLMAMSITSNFVFPVGTNMSERFLFFPSVAFCLLAGYAIQRLMQQQRIAGWIALGIICTLMMLKTVTRNMDWKDNYTLFNTDVKRAPNSAKLRNAAAGSTIDHMIANIQRLRNDEEKYAIMDDALEHLDVALRIHPKYKGAHLLRGNAFMYKDEFDNAVSAYEGALRVDPAYGEAKNNLSIALRQSGREYGEKKNDFVKSLELLKRSYELNANDSETIRLLGVAYGMNGRHNKAIEFFSELVKREPQNANFWKMLGTAYHNNGQPDERDRVLSKAKEIDPSSFE